MDRVRERQEVIVTQFLCNYQGHVNHGRGTWAELEDSIRTFLEVSEAIIERSKRKNVAIAIDLDSLERDLCSNLVAALEQHEFPVSPYFKNQTYRWLNSVFSHMKLPFENKEEQELTYAYVTYPMSSDVTLTCLEECNKMGNEDGTTGLVTWQGAIALYNFVATQLSHIFNQPKSKVSKTLICF